MCEDCLRHRLTASQSFPLGACSPEKEADRGGHILTSSENVDKRYHEINLMEYQENYLNKLYKMVIKPNPTTYTLLAYTTATYAISILMLDGYNS